MSATKEKLIGGIGCPISIREIEMGGCKYLFIATQDGKVHYHCNGKIATLVDLPDVEVSSSVFSKGLLGMELHPSFEDNNKFYLYYSIKGNGHMPLTSTVYPGLGDSLCQEWTEQDVYDHVVTVEEWIHNGFYGDYKCSAERNRVLLRLKQPFGDSKGHNCLYFDKTANRLLVSTNDGGSKYDPFNLSHDKYSLHGKVLSINVDEDNCWSVMEPIANTYEIPADREIVVAARGIKDSAGIIPVYGNELALVEMGQDIQSSITVAPIGRGPVDFGWRSEEGTLPTMRLKGGPVRPPTFSCEEPIHGSIEHTVTWSVADFPSSGKGKHIAIAPGDTVVFKSTDSKKYDLTETNSSWKPLLDPKFDTDVSNTFLYSGTFEEEDKFYLRCNLYPDVMRITITTKSSLARAREVRYQKYLSMKSKCSLVKPLPTTEPLYLHEYISNSPCSKPSVIHSKIDNSAITSAVYCDKENIKGVCGSFLYATMSGSLFTAKNMKWTMIGHELTTNDHFKEDGFLTLLGQGRGSLYLGSAVSPTKGAIYTLA